MKSIQRTILVKEKRLMKVETKVGDEIIKTKKERI